MLCVLHGFPVGVDSKMDPNQSLRATGPRACRNTALGGPFPTPTFGGQPQSRAVGTGQRRGATGPCSGAPAPLSLHPQESTPRAHREHEERIPWRRGACFPLFFPLHVTEKWSALTDISHHRPPPRAGRAIWLPPSEALQTNTVSEEAWEKGESRNEVDPVPEAAFALTGGQ